MNNKVKLTEEQRNLITSVLDDMYGVFDANTETWESFKAYMLEDNEPEQIDALIRMCEKYMCEEPVEPWSGLGTIFGFIMMYDMWINESSVWPVMYNPKWKKVQFLNGLNKLMKKVNSIIGKLPKFFGINKLLLSLF